MMLAGRSPDGAFPQFRGVSNATEPDKWGSMAVLKEGEAMSLSGAHKAAFRREVLAEGRVFAIRDGEGYPAPADPAGRRAVPFWSTPPRARRVADPAAAFLGFEIVVIELDDWLAGW